MTEIQQQLRSFKLLHKLFVTFLNIINRYKAQIQELEEKVAIYQPIENLFNDETINANTTDNEYN